MALQPGTRLGSFEVLGPLGAGGMGEVYRAHDKRLDRDVAIKVLPEAFARDPARAARFEREARLLAAINHPAIAAIYGAEELDSVRCIIMELVPGETLAERLTRGALPLGETLAIAQQIAEALEAAHEKGVVHRDLKPANIKITPEEKVKVLDLGLAKAMGMPSSDEGLSDSSTLTLDQTRPGVILGTVEFMSPEQARGKSVDKRTDIWAFGCILYEMLSGRRAFTGETSTDVFAAILTKEPDWSALPHETPRRLRELVSRCLEKSPAKRLRDIGDARAEMDRILSPAGEESAARVAFPWRKWSVAAAPALLLAGGLLWLILRPGHALPGEPISRKSLVVLPARVMGDYPGGQLIGDGLVETMSVRLNDVPGIQVVTPAAAVAASDKNSDPFGAARSVGANLVLRSSVVRSGERVRIIYSVWNVQTGNQLAGDMVDGSASDLLGLQDQLAKNVAGRLKLPGPARKTAPPTGLETASEQERYLQALGDLQRYDKTPSVEEAIRLLETLASERPASPLVHAALARAYLHRFNETRESRWVELATRSCSRARQLNPEFPEVDLTLGELRLRTGKAEEAISSFQRVLAAQPNNFQALLGLAEASDAAGHTARAETAYRDAVQLQPSFWAGYSRLAAFHYGHGQYSKAAEMFQRVTELTPDNANAFSNLGAAYGMMGRFEKALGAYEKSLVLAPSDIAYSNLGTAHFYLGHYRESAEAFQEAVRRTPGHFLFWANLGDADRWTKGLEARAPEAYRRAIDLAREELRINPRNAQALAYLALCLAKTGSAGEAEELAGRAVSVEPNNPEVLYNVAVVASLSGRGGEAVVRLRRAVDAGYPLAMVEHDPELARLRAQQEFRGVFRTQPEKTS